MIPWYWVSYLVAGSYILGATKDSLKPFEEELSKIFRKCFCGTAIDYIATFGIRLYLATAWPAVLILVGVGVITKRRKIDE
jgi:hypothetical protein